MGKRLTATTVAQHEVGVGNSIGLRKSLSALQQRHHLVEGAVGDLVDLGRGAVLDRMGHVDDRRLEAQRIALRGDAVDEFGGHDVDAGQAAAVETM